MSVETTIDFLSAALRAMRLESGRSGKHDLFADRLVKSASEPTAAVLEQRRASGVRGDRRSGFVTLVAFSVLTPVPRSV